MIVDKNNKSNTYYKTWRFSYDLKFSEDFLEIDEGERREYGPDGKNLTTFPHHSNGLESYIYVIDHVVEPTTYNYRCSALREQDSLRDLDVNIVEYRLHSFDQS